MAKIKLSAIGITNLSGKAGGSVFSRNRGGSYVKNFVIPTNTITDARQAVRALFGAISSAWRSLTQSQRNTWIEQAPNYLKLDVFADQKQLQPNSLFVAQNQALGTAGLPLINTIGSPVGTNGVVELTTGPPTVYVDSEDIGFEFDLEEANLDPGNHYVIEATPPHSASVRNVQNRFRIWGRTIDESMTPVTGNSIEVGDFFDSSSAAWTAYVAQFGAPSLGEMVSFRVKAVAPSTGETSAYFYARAIAMNDPN